MSKLYRNPPLIEALCEFRFKPSQPWDWTIPGLVYEKVRTEFPIRRQQNMMRVEVEPNAPENPQRIQGGIERMQFFREDEKALLQVGPDLLVINYLKPYPNWQLFQEKISSALETYRQVAQPLGFDRIGLRYINRIDTKQSSVELTDYLLSVPRVPDALPQVFGPWVQRVEIIFENLNGNLVLQSGSVQGNQQEGVSFILDLDFVSRNGDEIMLDKAMEWVGQAHDVIETSFEACITQRARGLFERIGENSNV